MKLLVFPGSFDPITVGHTDIIRRASKMADKLIVAVLNNPDKKCVFSVGERMELIKKSVSDLKNVEVDCFDGLMVDYVKKVNADAVVRGIRNFVDFEYEFNGAILNKSMYDGFEAIYLMTDPRYGYLSSSTVREIGKFGGDISKMVPEQILENVKNKFLDK